MPDVYEIDRSWKRSITTEPDKPFCTLLNAWDAMFYWSPNYVLPGEGVPPGAWVPRMRTDETSEDYTMKGFQLSHTTIVFDSFMYQETNTAEDGNRKMSLNTDGTAWSDWALRGLDVTIPKFDSRVTPLFLTEDNILQYVQPTAAAKADDIKNELAGLIGLLNPSYNDKVNNAFTDYSPKAAGKIGLKVYPKSAAMVPVNTFEAYRHSPFYLTGSPQTSSPNSWIDYPVPAAVSTEEIGGSKSQDANLVLVQHDYNFENKYLISKVTGKRESTDTRQAWDAILVNCLEETSYLIPYFALGGRNKNGLDINGIASRFYGNTAPSGMGLPVDYSTRPVARFLLKNSWFFIKSAFYADYVDYRDFAQSLNKEATVKHKTLIISKDGDADRFATGYDDEDTEGWKSEYGTEKTRPYAPVSSPSVDFVTESLVEGTKSQMTGSEADKVIKSLIKLGLDPEGTVGSLFIEPLETRSEKGNEEVLETLVPNVLKPIPPIFFDPSSRTSIESYNKDSGTENQVPVAVPRDGNLSVDGRILSPTIDELWAAIKMLASGRTEDPADPKIESASINAYDYGGYPFGSNTKRVKGDTHFTVKNFPFKTSTGVVLGDPIQMRYDFQPDSDRTSAPSVSLVSWVNDPSSLWLTLIREITGLMTSLTENGLTSYSNYLAELIEPKTGWATNFTGNDYPGQYDHAPYVMSLREIEALVKGLRYNFAYLVSILDKSNVWAGPRGQPNGDTASWNRAAGTAYMLHRDYSGLTTKAGVRAPHNTVWDARKEQDPNSSHGFGSLEWSASEKTPAWAVYLGADGAWHSSAQACVLPVIEERW